jgi:exodeoxyribonuclease V alpha subunit
MDIDTAINKHGKKLGSDQSNAVSTILTENISVMTGGPGVGKTTTLKTALNIFEEYGVSMALCAPTGMAAKRMHEATGREASTIHSLLEVDGEDGTFKRNANNPIDADIVVVDESSMTDIRLMSSLLKAIGPETSLLIVGDVDQLPSVGPGRVLHDIIASGAVPVSRLTQVFRQAEGSLIINAAHAINRGEMPDDRPVGVPGGDLDFLFLDVNSSERVEDVVLELICNRLKNHSLLQDGYDPIRDVMVVAAQKKKTAGVANLNLKLRAELNPLPNQGSTDRLDVHSLNDEGMVSFGVGDKVMNTANKFHKGIVNGDIGYIRHFDHLKKGMFVEFDCGLVELDKTDVRDQQLAYANTVHKSQGSESKVLIMPVVNDFGRMLQRNLIYTGLTRAKTLGIIVGQRAALEKAVANTQNQQRWSFTGEALRRAGERPEVDYGIGF